MAETLLQTLATGAVKDTDVLGSTRKTLAASRSVIRSVLRVSAPTPTGSGTVDHSMLAPILSLLESEGPNALGDVGPDLASYLEELVYVDPDTLGRAEALAFWINVYNAVALRLTIRAHESGLTSVFAIPGGFTEQSVSINGEALALDDIEHGKIRRFKNPRVHAALVCGSVSCPTLRNEPFGGEAIDRQLDEQMSSFLRNGALSLNRATATAELSRVFLWFGSDFTHPRWMPHLAPARARHILRRLQPWLDPASVAWIETENPAVAYQTYDWRLSCKVG